MAEPKKPSRLPRFELGTKVRVRYGVAHPDYPDIPLGGWSGVINESAQCGNEVDYEMEWDERTLNGIHPVYFKRCKRDDLEWEIVWLKEADLEPDDGAPIAIEQPTEIRTPPLSEGDREDRIRRVFGLTHDDPLPEVSRASIREYHAYLVEHLNFPFPARFEFAEDPDSFSRKRATISVTGLIDPEADQVALGYHLLCVCRIRAQEHMFPLDFIEVAKKNANFEPISDYTYWIQNWPCQEESDADPEDEYGVDSPRFRPFLKIFLPLTVWFGFLGAAIGAGFKTLPWAGLAALGGGVLVAFLGAFTLGCYGYLVGAMNRVRFGGLAGVLLGLLTGGPLGVIAGLMTQAFPWSPLGLTVGALCGPYLLPNSRGRLLSFSGALLGTCIGLLVSAFRHNRAQAISGASSGAITGLAIAAGLVLLLLGARFLRLRNQREQVQW